MEFTSFDFKILMAASIAIIAMSYTFPALGLTGNGNVDPSDIPQFNITADQFDTANEFPDRPNSPSQGQLLFNEELAGESDNVVWLDGHTNNGTEVVLLNNGDFSDPEPQIRVNSWESGSAVNTSIYNFTNVGDIKVHDDYGYEIQFTYDALINLNETDQTYRVRYDIRSGPSDTNWIRRIPIVGGVFSAGQQLAAIVGWIGSIGWFYVVALIESSTKIVIAILDIVTFLISLLHWLTTTYFAIVANASGYAAVFVLIPGIMLFVEFAKLAMIGVGLLPFT